MNKDRVQPPLNVLQFLCALRSSAPVFQEHVSLIMELARIEWEQERRRLLGLIFAGAFVLFCAMSFLTFSTAIILTVLWNTPYCAVAVSITLGAYAAGSIVAWFKFRRLLEQGSRSFSATRNELTRDIFYFKHKML